MKEISNKGRIAAGTRLSFFSLGPLESPVMAMLKRIREDRIIQRIWSHDHTVWKEDPSEITHRLGWLNSPGTMVSAVPEIRAFAEEVKNHGFTHALLLGMGGSSLAPEVFRSIFGVKKGYPDLAVLDSTDPDTVLAHMRRLDPTKTLFIVSTKSGGTVETFSLMKYFYNHLFHMIGPESAGKNFVAITDPGSGLESAARELGFRKIFLNDPDIGGRFSALSYFGLVPAALLGIDLPSLLEGANRMADHARDGNDPNDGDNLPALLGATMGVAANRGRDKLTLMFSSDLSPFGAWVEQLVAESTGKEGKGILPVDGETPEEPHLYGKDRLFVCLEREGENADDRNLDALCKAGHPAIRFHMKDLYAIGGQFFLWEMATALAGSIMGINPFDQPNVESAKVLARRMVSAYQEKGMLPEQKPALVKDGISVFTEIRAGGLREVLQGFLGQADSGGEDHGGRSYVAIHAYLMPSPPITQALHALRTKIHHQYHMAATVGYGPRFLHSTGQLHKGDKGNGIFIQITADTREDVPIPDQAGKEGTTITFGILKMAQALGDRQALLEGHRRVIRFHLGGEILGGVKRLMDVLD